MNESGRIEVIRWLPYGQHGILVELDPCDPSAPTRAFRALSELETLHECIPGAMTIYVESTTMHASALGDYVAEILRNPPRLDDLSVRSHTIPVVYDGDDLASVAELTGMSVEEVIGVHSNASYTVAFLGFSRSFPYLAGLDPRIVVPRLASPRTSVPAGSVAMGAGYTGIYPMSSPGGWRLLGHTDFVLFDDKKDRPNVLNIGDVVRFERLRGRVHATPIAPPPPTQSLDGPAFLVHHAGPFATVQDAGRSGRCHLGVARSGAFDRSSLHLANRLVGNDENEAALEVLFGPAEFEALGDDLVVACGGTDAEIHIVDSNESVRAASTNRAWHLRNGDRLRIGAPGHGLRTYLAVRGGIDAHEVLGSRSYDSLGMIGPRPLAPHDRVHVGGRTTTEPYFELVPTQQRAAEVEITSGPRRDWLEGNAFQLMLDASWKVESSSNRTGVRLSGPLLTRRAGDMASEAMVPGAVQLPPNGQPIVLGPDGGITGGYPVIAVVTQQGLDKLAQMRPGDTLRFRVPR